MATAVSPSRYTRAPRQAARTVSEKTFTSLGAPSLFAVICFSAGILIAHLKWFLPGVLLVALLAAFATATLAVLRALRLALVATALVYVILGVFCAEIAPPANPQKTLALLADNTPRTIEGEIVRLGPVRSVLATTPFSDKTHEEHSQQIDLRLATLGTARITLYAPVDQPYPSLTCNDEVRATVSLHQEERYLDPGVWDANEYLHEQGIGALGSVTL